MAELFVARTLAIAKIPTFLEISFKKLIDRSKHSAKQILIKPLKYLNKESN